jgi:beta-lactamase regulating signal transducer with metallopeptidase domain/DUF4097 and DUF4098 domain-containing protein YvlB
MIEQINHIAQLWWSGAVAMFWQVGVLIILIGCVDLIIRRWAWPQIRYALWLMVLLKLVLPPTISLSTSVTSGLQPLVKQIAAEENRRENLNNTTATILAHFEASVAESPAETVPSRETVTELQPAIIVPGSENVAGETLKASHIKLVWQAYAMAVWLAGMFILGGWLIIKLLHLRKEDHKLSSTAMLPESFYDATARCAKSLGLRRVPKVVLTQKVACPAVFGVVRPVLLMPVGYLSKMTRRDTEHMLLHELAHIKRGDLWVHGFYMLLQVVYWYNPLLWLVRNQMHHLRELCCDATVARLLKERISEYRQTLIDVARRYLTKPTEPGLGLLGLFEDSNRLLVRLNWLKKETWRYQKMKKLTVITTIALMLAFVLPMAQAQDKPVTENSSAETVKAEKQPAQSQDIQIVESEQQQKLQKLEVRLQQLNAQKQKLEQELKAMTQAKQAEMQDIQAEDQAKIGAKEAKIKAKEAKDKAEKASKEAEKAKDKAAKAKATAEAHKTEADAKRWGHWAKEMEVWAEQYQAHMNSPEVQEHYKNLADNQALKWVNSDEFKQWQKDMQQWSKEYTKAHKEYPEAHEQDESGDHEHSLSTEPHPMPVMPPMPSMPPMPAEMVAPDVVAPAPPAPPIVGAPIPPQLPTVVVPKIEHRPTNKVIVASPAEDVAPAPTLPDVKIDLDRHDKHVVVHDDKNGKFVATKEMHFVSKVKSGSPFIIRNHLGNIILKPSKDSTSDVRAEIQAKAETAAKAQDMVEQVSMNVNSSKERYYLKPVKKGDDKWNDISVDLYIAVPLGVQPDIKTDLGSIEMSNLRGKIKALTDLGSVKAVNTTGDLELTTKMGNIEFTAPEDLSAKFKAETKMGSIRSDLPLNINNKDMFKRTAEGTIGSGQDNIRLTTEMGSIQIKKYFQSTSVNNPMHQFLSKEVLPNSTDKLTNDKLTLERSFPNAVSLKITGTALSIKEEQEGKRSVVKRVEAMTVPLSSGSVLDIKNKDGNVTVQGSDTNQCSVTSTFTIKAPSMDQARDLSKKISLETKLGNKKLTLKNVSPRKTPSNHTYYVNLNINVPHNTAVTLHKEDGDIRITNLEGQIQIGSEDGNITCENVTGETSLASEDGDITYTNITGNARIHSEDGNVNIKASRLTQLNIKKEDGNIHCDDISGNCDVSIEDGNVTISYAEGTAENCTCIVRGEDGSVKINNGTFAKCQINRESGTINCKKVNGNFDVKLEEGQVVVDYADNVPESCSINARIEEGSIRLTAPSEMFPADAPSQAKKKDDGAEWMTKASTSSGGVRTVSLQVDEGSVKVEKR